MKKKGISLIVLIITIVVILIIATAIIVNLAETNIIGNANEAVLKQDIATLQSELDMYISDKFVDKKGKYDSKKLNANQTIATYETEPVEDKNSDGSSNIYDILTSLQNSKYKNNVYIKEGKLVFKNRGLTEKEIELIMEIGLEVDGIPKITNITTESTLTSIDITLNVTLVEEVEKYVYILNDGKREESTELTKTYTGLTPGVNYTLEVILVLKDGTEISKKEIISTKNIDGELTYTLNKEEWTTEDWTTTDVEVTIEYSEETMPEGYELQYRMVNANLKETDEGYIIQEWAAYTAPVVVTTNNTTVAGRLYNDEIENGDEKLGSSITISNIDKDAPTTPTTLTLTSTGDTITAVADGSVDTGSGFDKYMYSIDNTTWQENNQFIELKSGTEYTVYAKAIDSVGNESEVKDETITTKIIYNVTTTLGNCVTTDNTANKVVEGGSYVANFTTSGEYYIKSITATMGEATIEGDVSTGNITITNVTSDVQITVVTRKNISSTSRYYIVEVFGHYEGNGAIINELEFSDNSGNKVEYTVINSEAYDSVIGSLPEYWNDSIYSYANLNDGEFDDNYNNCTIFFTKYGLNTYGSNSTCWARFIVDLGEIKNISDIEISLGNQYAGFVNDYSNPYANRTPKSVSVYEVDEYSDSTYTNNIKQRNDEGLSLINTLEFDRALPEPTWFSFAE